MNNSDNKTLALKKICEINSVEGFDPSPFAVEYNDLNTGEINKRLPVMAQLAWFRLKYPEGRIAVNVTHINDYFVASAKVYCHYKDSEGHFLAEASAVRGYSPDKPTISPREWAQTAAIGIALRNAGFGLQFSAAGESFDLPAINESGAVFTYDIQGNQNTNNSESLKTDISKLEENILNSKEEPMSLEKAKLLTCPISKYSGKTLGDLIMLDPKALVWIANKFTGNEEISEGAKLICEHALATA